MNEYKHLISLCDQFIKEGCEKKQHVMRERRRCRKEWRVRMMMAVLLGLLNASLAAALGSWIVLACTVPFAFSFFQARYHLYDCDKGWAELEQMCQDLIEELIEDREEYKRQQKEEYGY